MTDKVNEDRVIASIRQQFRGGERKFAGLRASEFAYTKGKINQKLADKVIAAVPGIDRYIAPPAMPVEFVADEAGNPMPQQPEL